MSRRSSSLTTIDTALQRELDGKYAIVKKVADSIDSVETLAAEDIAGLLVALNEAKDFTGISVVQGASTAWDPVTKTITVATEKGDQGESVSIDSVVDNSNGTFTWNFSDGSTFTTSDLRGQKGLKGDKGDTGDALTLSSVVSNGNYTYTWLFSDGSSFTTGNLRGGTGEQGPAGPKGDVGGALTLDDIIYNNDGTFTWKFSDSTSYVTPNLKGDKGDDGAPGIRGLQGVSVHHSKPTNTTDPEGDFGTFGELDTYTLYGDAEETINLGHFVVRNGFTPDQADGLGYMRRSAYDTSGTGIVDNAEAVGGKTLSTIETERDLAIQQAGLGLGTNFTVNTVAERNALTELTVGDKVFVQDDGDGRWAQYWVTGITDGVGATSTFEVVMDEDTYLNANSKEQVKTAYESNPDTNAYTDAEKTKLADTEVTAQLDFRDTANRSTDNHVDGTTNGVYTLAERSKLASIEVNAKDDQLASEVPVTALGNLTSTNVQDALVEVQVDLDTHKTSTGDEHTYIDQDVTSTGNPNFDSVQLNGGTGDQGRISWNADEETLDLVQNGAVLQLGQEVQVHCRNGTGSTITNGTVVMATGTLGASGRILVAPAVTTDAKLVLGIATEDIPAGSDGKVTTIGKVRGIDTSGFTEGAVLYLNSTTGGLTSVRPSTGLIMAIAFVISSTNNGTLMVRAVPTNELFNDQATEAHGWGDWSVGVTKAFVDALGVEAATATKLQTARTVSLTGDVTGSTSFDGSGNVSIIATVADDSHNHVIANVDGLQAALDSKAAIEQTSTTGTKYVDKTTAVEYKMYMDNGEMIMEEL